MLLKMGWSEGKGLGRNEDGMSSHIRVKRKVESEGIGFVEDGQGNAAFVHQIHSFNEILAGLNEDVAKKQKKRKRKAEDLKEQVKKKKKKVSVIVEDGVKVKKLKSKSKSKLKKTGEKEKTKEKKKKVKVEVKVGVAAVKRKHARFLKAKNVRGYSSADLKAILGGSR